MKVGQLSIVGGELGGRLGQHLLLPQNRLAFVVEGHQLTGQVGSGWVEGALLANLADVGKGHQAIAADYFLGPFFQKFVVGYQGGVEVLQGGVGFAQVGRQQL